MAEVDALRRELDEQRARISTLVGEIENRVVPARRMNRTKDRWRERLVVMRTRVMGSVEPAAGSVPTGSGGRVVSTAPGAHLTGTSDRAAGGESGGGHLSTAAVRSTAEGVAHSIHEAPQALRERVDGAPMAAGMFAFALGALGGALLPQSAAERRLAEKAAPTLETAVEHSKEMTSELAHTLSEPVQQAASTVRDAAKDAASEVAGTVGSTSSPQGSPSSMQQI